MCGITGLLSSNASIAQEKLNAMNKAISHRGPDDEGYVLFSKERFHCLAGSDTPMSSLSGSMLWAPHAQIEGSSISAHLGFGHRRLSIVDLSPLGHQPMCNPTGRYWITYNGEIYNHLELREELEKLNHQFSSHSDTEVILAAYAQWGEGCLSRFNGMWAFAIYDRELDVLFMARDRFGVKPLYYWVTPEKELAFASEIKQFTELPGWGARVNGQRAYDFLVWGVTDHTDETLFSSVYQLRPGHCISMKVSQWTDKLTSDGRLRASPWYELKKGNFSGTFEEAATEFRRLLTDSISLRLRADVPIGSCLSGGLDSSSIVCVMNDLLRQQDAHSLQKTFSACSDVARFDERNWIEAVVSKTGVDAHYVYPDLNRLFEESQEITWHQDEPFGSTSIYAQWNVFRLAAENGVKVMLDGQGADEQLAGYHGFFSPRLSTLFRSLRWMSLLREMRAMRKIHGYSPITAAKYLANGLLPDSVRDVLKRSQGMTHRAPEWLNPGMLGCIPANPFSSFDEQKSSSIQEFSHVQLTSSTLQMLLHWEDRDSMAHSIESRVPFLDYRLVEFVLGLPDEYKISDGITKKVLRSGMSGILPDSIRDRMDKLGFVTAEEVWIRERAQSAFRDKLDTAIEASSGVLRPSAGRILEQIISGERPFNFLVWRMVNFGEWIQKFDVRIH
jgi:asparagine synthase (glutamine-hydrolysing)